MPPLDYGILTLALWALHGKNGTKSRQCPPPLIEGVPPPLPLSQLAGVPRMTSGPFESRWPLLGKIMGMCLMLYKCIRQSMMPKIALVPSMPLNVSPMKLLSHAPHEICKSHCPSSRWLSSFLTELGSWSADRLEMKY